MKYISLLVILYFLSCNGGYKDVKQQEKEERLNNYLQNSNIKDSLKIKECDFFDETSEGGVIKGYYIKNHLSKIKVSLFGELGKVSKEFINYKSADSFKFKQKYYYYNKPFYEKDYKIIDSIIITGIYNNEVMNKKIIGNKTIKKNIDEILFSMKSSKEKYTIYLEKCNPTR